MSAAPPVYAQARAETAAMLGYDLASLTAEQATRLDVAAALRLAVDDQSGKLARGETADVTKLLSASEALARLLPPLREPPPPANREDPRQIMLRTYMEMRRRGALHGEGLDGLKLTVEKLRAELAAKDAKIAELEAALAVSGGSTGTFVPVGGANVPAGDNVVPLRDPPSPPAAPPRGLLTDDAPEPWRPFVSGGAHYDRWGNHN